MTTRSSTFGSVRGGCTVRVSRAGLSGHAREMAPAVLPCISAASVLYDTVDPALGKVFAQLAMSIGGALVEMMPP